LAEDLTKVLVSAFSYKGFAAQPVFTSHTDTPEAVVRKVAGARTDRGVVVTLVDWKSDTYFKTELFYDLRLKILNADAKVLAERQVAGHDKEITGTASNAFREKVELLLNHPDTIQALGPQGTLPGGDAGGRLAATSGSATEGDRPWLLAGVQLFQGDDRAHGPRGSPCHGRSLPGNTQRSRKALPGPRVGLRAGDAVIIRLTAKWPNS
jgi:hypothetical protein